VICRLIAGIAGLIADRSSARSIIIVPRWCGIYFPSLQSLRRAREKNCIWFLLNDLNVASHFNDSDILIAAALSASVSLSQSNGSTRVMKSRRVLSRIIPAASLTLADENSMRHFEFYISPSARCCNESSLLPIPPSIRVQVHQPANSKRCHSARNERSFALNAVNSIPIQLVEGAGRALQ